jgi:hypothetical protein
MGYRSCDGIFVVFAFECFDLFNVSDVVLDTGEGGQCFSGNGVSQILLNLHGDFDSVQGIETMISKRAGAAHT